jgi:hypothetical protein
MAFFGSSSGGTAASSMSFEQPARTAARPAR